MSKIFACALIIQCFNCTVMYGANLQPSSQRRPSLIERLTGKTPKNDGDQLVFANEKEAKEWLDKAAAKGQELQMPPKRRQQLLAAPDVERSEPAAIVHSDGSFDLFANDERYRAVQQSVVKVMTRENRIGDRCYEHYDARVFADALGVMLHIVQQARKNYEATLSNGRQPNKELVQSINHAQQRIDEFIKYLSEQAANDILKRFAHAYKHGNIAEPQENVFKPCVAKSN